MKSRGVTLIEVMLALAILMVALLALATLFGASLRLQEGSDTVVQASEVGRDLMEAIKENGHAGAPAGTAVFDGRTNDPPDAGGFPPAPYPTAVVDGRSYPVRVTVAPQGSQLKSVEVEVFWEGGRLTFQSYLHP